MPEPEALPPRIARGAQAQVFLLAPALLVGVLVWSGTALGRACILAAALLAFAGVVVPPLRRAASWAVAGLLLVAASSLAIAFLTDDFSVHAVWLYSAPQLPWYLKLSDLWGGDEGTLLVLATLLSLCAVPLSRRAGWAGAGALALAAFFALGALIWDPFRPTPAAALAAQPYRGMNAHLVHVWMAFHPPFLFASYALFLAPAGTALQALATGNGSWKEVADWTVRLGWWTLSLGLALGMWWAYEDFTFGQIWHWDPVQTGVFAVWALATAHVHCLRRYRPDGAFARTHPLHGLLTGIVCLVSLAVTRSPVLASSHRYVGQTSLPLLVTGAAVLAVLGLAALAASFRPSRSIRPAVVGETGWLLRAGIWGLVACAAVALVQLAHAYLSAVHRLPRPPDLRPFFEMLTRWAPAAEMRTLRRAFAQWDVDGRAVNAWLIPVGILVGFLIGHTFLPIRSRWSKWAITGFVAAAALVVSLKFKPLDAAFAGGGMTSSRTVANFRFLEILFAAMAYAAVSMAWWSLRAATKRLSFRILFGFSIPVGAIHLGVAVALIAATVAMVFDTYAQKVVSYPPDIREPLRFPGGYAVTLRLDPEALPPDGGRGQFRAVARVGWSLARDGKVVEQAAGHTVYRDDRSPDLVDSGPMRLMCEILDYRYARYVSGTRQMMHPFIHRGLWRDVQLWFPAMSVPAKSSGSGAMDGGPSDVPVVLKIYPLMSWLWVGLALTLASALLILVFRTYRPAGRRAFVSVQRQGLDP